MIAIMGKEKISKRFKSFDYASGMFVGNIIFQTMWANDQRQHVEGLIDSLHKLNPDYEFKIIKRR